MASKPIEESFTLVVTSTWEVLKPLGFKRQGKVFRILVKDMCGIIDFQRSTTSTANRIQFTINVGVACGDLLEPWDPKLQDAVSSSSQLRERIGALMPERCDKWWEIVEGTDREALAREMTELIIGTCVPYVMPYLDRHKLIELWESGRSPGLTGHQRIKYLARLKSSDSSV